MLSLERRVIKLETARGGPDAWLRALNDEELERRLDKVSSQVIDHPDTPEDIREASRKWASFDFSTLDSQDQERFGDHVAWLRARLAEDYMGCEPFHTAERTTP